MRLADDERARVPFAVIGVLVLVSSLAVVTVQFDDARVDRDARLAGDRAEASAETALRDATRAAGAAAAADPVVEPADTEYGALLSEDRPYRDYLALLVALRLRQRLAGTEQRVDDAHAAVALPPIDDAESAAAALEATTVRAAGAGLVEVTVADATVVVRRGDDVVDRRNVTLSATVTTPTLEVHDRTAEFDRLLDAGPGTRGSLGRGLTGGLYGLGWARGYGQYAGLPIDDVIANRHVELVTNLAVIDAQRAAFGNADRRAETGLVARAVRVANDETVGFRAGGFADAALPAANEGEDGPSLGEVTAPPSRTATIAVDETADRALADVVRPFHDRVETDVEGPEDVVALAAENRSALSLERLVRAASSVEARVATATDPAGREQVGGSAPEDPDAWTREELDRERAVVAVEPGSGPDPAVGGTWSVAVQETRTVTVEETVSVAYTHDETGNVTVGEEVYRYDVAVGVALAHRPFGDDLPAAPLAAPGDGLHGRLVDHAGDRLIADRGGVDGLARAAALGEEVPGRQRFGPADVGADVSGTVDAVYADLTGLRERLRTERVETERAFVATDADPAARLADRLRARRGSYVGVPATYDDLEHRATVVARAAYVDRTVTRVEARSATTESARSALSERVDDMLAFTQAGLTDLLDVGLGYARPDPRPVDAAEPAPDTTLTVDADPSYLELGAVNDTAVPPPTDDDGDYYPLVARTRTVGSLSTDEFAERVASVAVDLFDEPERRVPVTVAARSLRGADTIPAEGSDLHADRERLRESVQASLADLEARSETVVAEQTALDADEADAVVDEALARWDGPAARILAFDNGSAPAEIGAVAADREDVDDLEGDRVETLLRDAVPEVLAGERATVPVDEVEPVVNATRRAVATTVVDASEEGVNETVSAIEDRYNDTPLVAARGVPVAPVPSWWVATANVWVVDVRGRYASFRVRARQGGPDGGSHVTYVRDGGPVGVDVTGDGRPERLGRSSRIEFEASTAVVVAVPPTGGGLGNDASDWSQTSPGWSELDAEAGATPEVSPGAPGSGAGGA